MNEQRDEAEMAEDSASKDSVKSAWVRKRSDVVYGSQWIHMDICRSVQEKRACEVVTEWLFNNWKNPRLAGVEDCGHFLQLELPNKKTLPKLIDFGGEMNFSMNFHFEQLQVNHGILES